MPLLLAAVSASIVTLDYSNGSLSSFGKVANRIMQSLL